MIIPSARAGMVKAARAPKTKINVNRIFLFKVTSDSSVRIRTDRFDRRISMEIGMHPVFHETVQVLYSSDVIGLIKVPVV